MLTGTRHKSCAGQVASLPAPISVICGRNRDQEPLRNIVSRTVWSIRRSDPKRETCRMAGRWWRAYDEALHDPKLQRLPPHLFKTWFNLLCIASQCDGILPGADDLAYLLRRRVEDVRRDVAELCTRRLFDATESGITPHNWDTRQYKSDLSTQRVKQHRKRFRNVSGNVSETAMKRPQIQSTETEKKVPARKAPDFDFEPIDEDPKAKLFRKGKTILVSLGVSEGRSGSVIGQWLKQRNDAAGILAALEYAVDHSVIEPIGYVTRVLKENGGRDGTAKGAELAFELAEEARSLERAAGIGRPAAAK